MQPQQPGQPGVPQPNYDFIMNPQTPQKRPIVGGSMASRILVVVLGLFGLAIIAAVFMSFIGSSSASFKNDDILSVAQDQTELVRLSVIGNDDGVSQRVKNFSTTAQLSLASDQKSLITYSAKNGYEVDAKALPLKLNNTSTTRLSDSATSGTFDSTYTSLMKQQVGSYQGNLKKAFDGANSETKKLLSDQYDHATLLLNQLDATN